MNQHLQSILNFIQQDETLTAEEKSALLKSLKDADKEIEITSFKLDRTEKVKRTTAILLEETIEELEQKRKAVEAQNRVLEIETSLERVRTVAMSMNKPDDMLLVCRIISEQLELLNVKDIRNLQTAIINEAKGIYLNYEYFTQYKRTSVLEIVTKLHPTVEEFANEMMKSKDAFFTKTFEGKELQDWRDYRKKTNQDPDPVLDEAKSVHYYFYSIGTGALGISTYAPLCEEEINLFKRFRNVFDLAYRRFIDIEKAIAQAREAQIETSLERVRAQAMAMRKPEELTGISEVLYAELKTLGFTEIRNAMINIHDDEKETFVNYDYSDEIGKSINHLTYNIHPLIEKQMRQIRGAEGFSETFYTGKDLEDMIRFRKNIGEKDDPRINNADALFYYFYSIGNGSIGISTFSVVAGEKLEVLKRFRNVFTLSYQRYADIALAEAQAKEARIETALERVRAVAMAMRNPGDLSGISETLFTELKALGFADLRNTEIIINNDTKETIISYYYSDYGRTGVLEMDYKANPVVHKWADDLRKADDAFAEVVIPEKDLIEWEKFAQSIGYLPDTKLDKIKAIYYYSYSIGLGALSISSFTSVAKEQVGILERFRNVFNLSYQRYSDIALAEAQSREAKIELALERVRARTMAMQKSEELPETAFVLYQQFKELGEDPIQITIGIMNEAEGVIEFNVTDWAGGGSQINNPFNLSIEEPTLLKKAFTAWKAQKKSLVVDLTGEELEGWIEYRNANTGVTVSSKDTDGRRVISIAFFSKGHISISSPLPRPKETIELLERFAGVFDQTYTRFLDLQKAEAQAREAQIETTLERVRSRTMAMQKSDELTDVAGLLFEQVSALGIKTWTAGFNVWSEDNNSYVDYITSPQGGFIEPYTVYTDTAEALTDISNARKSGIEFDVQYVEGEKIKQLYLALTKLDEKQYEIMLQDGVRFPSHQYEHFVFGSKVSLMFITYEPVPEAHDIFKRLGKVFEQTYTRFLDLKKAEAQTREAQIEAALERVRSKTMTMHNSQDVGDTVAAMFDELVKLGIEKTIRCGIIIIDDTKQMEVWNASDNGEGKINLVIGRLDMTIHPALLRVYDAWKNKLPEISYEFIGEDLKDYFRVINDSPEYPFQMDIASLPSRSFLSDYFFADGAIFAFTHDEIATETTQIFKRFAAVFGQTYRRYLDLLKAEAQAREAQIEVSLERVRAQTMAMNKSQDLQEVVSVIFRELDKQDLKTIRCGIGIINAQNRTANIWSTTTTKEGNEVNFSGNESLDIHPVHKGTFAGWQKQEDFYYVLEAEDLINYYDIQKGDNYNIPDTATGTIVSENDRQYYFCTYFPAGGIYFFKLEPFTEELVKLIRRFASAFSLAYKRFEDLKQSEARALEVLKESSLDRVRAETASMRTTADLERITPLIWNELTTLGVPFIRCGVFIIDEAQQQVHTFLSTPDGKAITAFHLPYNTSEQITQIVIHWQQNKIYKDHWDEAAFDEWTNTLVEKGIIQPHEQYRTSSHPANLHLHFLPFLQGMLYVGSDGALNEEEILLIQSLAGAFSSAYARYEDFNKLELAKEQIEKTLVDLKQAQTQLVQSEKMASLGELTAGIAHEIQNPLNFVNNFSEVNTELINEMKEEIDKGNLDDAKAIANDIKENEQKINHHGKRADAIVKGMLQHSRTSSATKEPTDINKLADEYLRLAYHGLRAKDKSFNATLNSNYDKGIEKINVIPQDIGRVILNLITNAFYAVAQRQKEGSKAYEPTVTVSTKKEAGKVSILVKDNGNGISQKIIDKIFQPFFTTKPTGQGTGLGLSLAYDIVKAHGGELKVETKENEGSTFIIQLPTN